MSLKTLLEKLSIRTKTTACFAVVLAIVAVLGAASVHRLTTLDSTVNQLTSDTMPGLEAVSAMREALLRYRLGIARYMAGDDFSSDFDKTTEQALATYREQDTK